MLEKWVVYWIYGSTLPKQGKVKPETVSSYIFMLKSYHINRQLSLKAFDIPCITLIIKGGKRLFPKQNATRLLITKDILKKMIENKPINLDELNIGTAFNMAWASFLHPKKITYANTEIKKA